MAKTSCKKGQYYCNTDKKCKPIPTGYKVREDGFLVSEGSNPRIPRKSGQPAKSKKHSDLYTCLLYTSPSPRDGLLSRMPSSA